MKIDSFFNTEENIALTSICARASISDSGIGAIIFGVLNMIIGIVTIHINIINAGLIILGMMMIILGIYAKRKPALDVLKGMAIIAALVFVWNVGISILNTMADGKFYGRGLLYSSLIAYGLFDYYRRLRPIREQIESVEPEKINQRNV